MSFEKRHVHIMSNFNLEKAKKKRALMFGNKDVYAHCEYSAPCDRTKLLTVSDFPGVAKFGVAYRGMRVLKEGTE